jgi:hypothetical protein
METCIKIHVHLIYSRVNPNTVIILFRVIFDVSGRFAFNQQQQRKCDNVMNTDKCQSK